MARIKIANSLDLIILVNEKANVISCMCWHMANISFFGSKAHESDWMNL